MTQKEKDHLIECLKNLEQGIIEALGKGAYKNLQNTAVLFSSIVNLNDHLMALPVEEKKEENKNDLQLAG